MKVRHHLPAVVSRFIGRNHEVDACKRLLEAERLLTLTGPGGCGKSRLALQVAEAVQASYPDGVWLVELARLVDPVHVAHAVCTTLGIDEGQNDEADRRLTAFLEERHLLLILDNCEHLLSACERLASALLKRCPGLRILATSREVLGIPGEVGWPVPPLSLPRPADECPAEHLIQYDAIRLFLDRAAQASPALTVPQEHWPVVCRICQRLDGLPLAIELAAARTRLLSLSDIEARLDDRFRLLTTKGEAIEPRQRTLQATVSWSYQLLTPAEQRLWARLAIFVGSFQLQAAESICAWEPIDSGAILDLLGHLVEKSIVRAQDHDGSRRYHMLETIRQFGLERLREADETEALWQRYIDWYLTIGEETYDLEYDSMVKWLGQELPNLLQALHRVDERGEIEKNLRLRMVMRFRDGWQHVLRVAPTYFRELAARVGQVPLMERAKALSAAAWFADRLGDYTHTERCAKEAFDLWAELQNQKEIAHTLVWLGHAAAMQGEYGRASALYEQAWTIYQQMQHRNGTIACLLSRGMIAAYQGDYQAARAAYEEVLHLYRSVQNRMGMAGMYNALGGLAAEQGEYGQALDFHTMAMSLSQEAKSKVGIRIALGAMGVVYKKMGNAQQAAQLLAECLTMLRQAEVITIAIISYLGEYARWLAGLACMVGRFEEASRLAGGAVHIERLVRVHVLLPAERRSYEQELAQMRQQLGDEPYEAAWTAGNQMSPEQLLEEAAQTIAQIQASFAEQAAPALSPPEAAAQNLADVSELTERERDIVRLVAQGLSGKEIGRRLYISYGTVRAHIDNVYNKLGFNKRASLAAWAIRNGLL